MGCELVMECDDVVLCAYFGGDWKGMHGCPATPDRPPKPAPPLLLPWFAWDMTLACCGGEATTSERITRLCRAVDW